MPKPFRVKGREKLLQLALVKFGGESGLARKLNVHRQAIHQWNCIPVNRVATIKKLVRSTGVQT